MSLLDLEDLSATVRGTPLVDGVTCTAEAGTLTAVLGPNGAGKSTLLRLVAGEMAPMRGRLHFQGRPLSAWSAPELARRRAVMPQATTPIPLRVEEVVALGRTPHRRNSSAARDAAVVEQVLHATDTAHLVGRPFASLSGGERQRVTLARALAQLPDDRYGALLLLDEPTAALDPAHQHAVMGVARRLAEQGAAVIAVLHDVTLALRYASHAVLLRDGRQVAAGPAAEGLTPARLSAAYGCAVRFLDDPVSGTPVAVTGLTTSAASAAAPPPAR